MNARRARYLALAVWAVAGAASAGPVAEYPDLPPLAVVERAIADTPSVRAARDAVGVGDAERTKLRAGPYEYSVEAGVQQRRVAEDPARRFGEWSLALSRPLRLPAKGAIDDQLGDNALAAAKLAYGDALHEAGRRLLALWFAWVRGSEQARQWQQQTAVLQRQLDVVRTRVRAGDAPHLEAILAEAALAQAQSSLQQARLAQRTAATDLAQWFPGVPLPQVPVLVAPERPGQDLAYWRRQVLQHSHRLALARAEAARWQLLASRAQADLTPDPTLGVHYARERGGEEQIVGVSISIPFPGQARSASVLAAQAQASAIAQSEAEVLASVTAETDNLYASAVAAYDSWQSTRDAAGGMQRSAELMARAYALGETSLSDVLTARRQAVEAALAATLAQVNAAESRYRLLLDAHELWPLDADEGAAGH